MLINNITNNVDVLPDDTNDWYPIIPVEDTYVENLLRLCIGTTDDMGKLIPEVVKYCVDCMFNTAYICIYYNIPMGSISVMDTKCLVEMSCTFELIKYISDHIDITDVSISTLNKLISVDSFLRGHIVRRISDITTSGRITYDQMLRKFAGEVMCWNADYRIFAYLGVDDYPVTAIHPLVQMFDVHKLKPHLYEAVSYYRQYYKDRLCVGDKELALLKKFESVLVNACINREELFEISTPNVDMLNLHDQCRINIDIVKRDLLNMCIVYGVQNHVDYLFDRLSQLHVNINHRVIDMEQYTMFLGEISACTGMSTYRCHNLIESVLFMFKP